MNPTCTGSLPAFRNLPFTDFTMAENKRSMLEALERARAELALEYDLVVGGRRMRTEQTFDPVNPAQPSEVIGRHFEGGPAGARLQSMMSCAISRALGRRVAQEPDPPRNGSHSAR